MIPIFLTRTGTNSGHTLLAWSLGTAIRERGLKLGIFKPYGTIRQVGKETAGDRDVSFLAEQFEVEDSLDQICPLVFPEGKPPLFSPKESEEFEKKVRSCFESVSKNKDAVLILGSQGIFFDSGLPGFPDSKFIQMFQSKILLIDAFKEEHTSTYSILSVSSLLKDFLETVIINRVPADKVSRIKGSLLPFLSEKGVHVSALISEDDILSAQTVEEIAQELGAEIHLGGKGLAGLVNRASIDSSYLDGKLGILRKMRTKILLLGRDPGDWKNADPKAPLKLVCIISTSGRIPGTDVEELARERGIALLRIKEDAFTTLEKLDSALRHPSVQGKFKVERFREHIEKEGGMDNLLNRFLK